MPKEINLALPEKRYEYHQQRFPLGVTSRCIPAPSLNFRAYRTDLIVLILLRISFLEFWCNLGFRDVGLLTCESRQGSSA